MTEKTVKRVGNYLITAQGIMVGLAAVLYWCEGSRYLAVFWLLFACFSLFAAVITWEN